MKFHYGLKSIAHAEDLAVSVCNVMGHGANNVASSLLLETCAVETQMGTYEDPTPSGAGRGCCQIDPIGLEDIKLNSTEHFDTVFDNFGYDISKVCIDDVQNDPLLAFILCRLHYKRIPAPIPLTKAKRAQYWKDYYNTKAGKGTLRHYIQSEKRWLQ